MANETTNELCSICNHKHYKKYAGCPQCNCGESERIHSRYDWRGFNPEAMYNGVGADPYERGRRGELKTDDQW